MGIALWLLAGAVAWFVARIIPFARPATRIGEVLVSLSAAFLLGVVATALDFGGWREMDWRAALFAFFGALAATGAFRLATSGRRGGA